MSRALIESIADHALSVRLSDVPDTAVHAAQRLVLDAVGVGVAGSRTPESERALAAARSWGEGDEAGVWGTGARLPAGSAAFVNGHQMHCLEYDAIHEPAVVHPMTVVFPVLGAYCDRLARQGRTVSGPDLLAAVMVGVDVAAGLGDVTTTPLRFFRPATAGALGAVAALATLERPDSELAVGALGVVYGGLSGTMQPHREGAQVLALQIGFNARAALHSYDLAVAGFRGPREILEGPYGYFHLIEADGDPDVLVDRLGKQWEVERTSIKPFPSGRATHGALDGVLELRARHDLRFEEIAAVDVRVPPMVHTLVGREPHAGMSAGAARLCLRYLIPVALREGRIDLSAYESELLADPELLDLSSRVRVEADDNPDPNAFDPQTVVITMRDGTRHDITKERSLGSPDAPVSETALTAKARANLAAGGLGAQADDILAAVAALPDADDVSPLWELL